MTSSARNGLMAQDNIIEIELAFMNCESVLVDMHAVSTLRMTTDHDDIYWDADHQTMCTDHILKSFYISLDISKVQLFRKRFISCGEEGPDSRIADGMSAVNRIRTSHDLTSIYINGTKYVMPTNWKPGDIDAYNLLQTTSELTTGKGDHKLDIHVIPEAEFKKSRVF